MLTSQRKAWNEAMRSAAGGAGAGVLPSQVGGAKSSTRRSDRHRSTKHGRRGRARKKSTNQFPDSASGEDQREYLAAVRIDSLEEVADVGDAGGDDEEEFDLLEDEGLGCGVSGAGGVGESADAVDNAPGSGVKKSSRRSRSRSCAMSGGGGGGGTKKRGGGGDGLGGSGSGASSSHPSHSPKRLKPRTLASILLEDAGRPDGVTKKYLDSEARPERERGRWKYPPRKFCPVTGLFGIYTDPKSGIPYASLTALEQIRERAPPWMSLGGSTAYSEAVKSLRDED